MIRNIKIIIMLTFIWAVYFFSSSARAWNFTGHVLIAQIAHDNLQPEKKIQADTLALIIFNELPKEQQEKLNRQYPNASTFAKIALMPDIWRKWKVATLFRKYHAALPWNLFLASQQSTASWHFIDKPYPNDSECYMNRHNVVWAIETLQAATSKANNDNTKALLMVLREHYIADLHQPLHTLTKVGKACNNDRGGNDFCIRTNEKGKCTKNLHSLWDSGVGYLRRHENIKQLAYELEQSYPHVQFLKFLENKTPQNWASESYGRAGYIYGLAASIKPSQVYYQNGQAIAKFQIALAGYRLAAELNQSL